jgi:hypothetical protein
VGGLFVDGLFMGRLFVGGLVVGLSMVVIVGTNLRTGALVGVLTVLDDGTDTVT